LSITLIIAHVIKKCQKIPQSNFVTVFDFTAIATVALQAVTYAVPVYIEARATILANVRQTTIFYLAMLSAVQSWTNAKTISVLIYTCATVCARIRTTTIVTLASFS
jgi:hypothetical protein